MTDSEWKRRGTDIRRELYGPDAVERSNAGTYATPIMKEFIDYASEAVFGGLWGRPGLSTKMRAFTCVVSDAATGREGELRIHLRFALNQGWTEGELTEAILHLSGYVGLPLVRGALLTAEDEFARLRLEAEEKS